jgi:hypothetical protein
MIRRSGVMRCGERRGEIVVVSLPTFEELAPARAFTPITEPYGVNRYVPRAPWAWLAIHQVPPLAVGRGYRRVQRHRTIVLNPPELLGPLSANQTHSRTSTLCDLILGRMSAISMPNESFD